MSLTFAELRRANVARCEGPAFAHSVFDWSPNDWATAVAGEVGEACNMLKKMRRGEGMPLHAVAYELADAVIYIDLLAARLGISLGEAVAEKFNLVSEKRGAAERLSP